MQAELAVTGGNSQGKGDLPAPFPGQGYKNGGRKLGPTRSWLAAGATLVPGGEGVAVWRCGRRGLAANWERRGTHAQRCDSSAGRWEVAAAEVRLEDWAPAACAPQRAVRGGRAETARPSLCGLFGLCCPLPRGSAWRIIVQRPTPTPVFSRRQYCYGKREKSPGCSLGQVWVWQQGSLSLWMCSFQIKTPFLFCPPTLCL